jgi:tetratricopeptide (TPR) repeat protein
MGNIAEVYFEIGLYEQALPIMEKTFNPDQYIDYLNLALCYYKTGKLEQAKRITYGKD